MTSVDEPAFERAVTSVDEAAFERAVTIGGMLGEPGAVIDAELIRRFCVHRGGEVDPRGIRLQHTRITGTLDLTGVDVPFPLHFDKCSFDNAPILHGTRVKELILTGCPALPGLRANGISVQGDLNLSGSHVVGAHATSASTSRKAAIWLCESTIGGRLLCLDTTIDPGGERAMQADRMQVGGTVRFLHSFHAKGELRLVGIEVGGSFDMTGARVESESLALDLGDAAIAGNLFIVPSQAGRRPEIHGRIDLGSTRIDAQLLIRDATLVKPDRTEGYHYSRVRFHDKAITGLRLFVGAEFSIEGDTSVVGGIDVSSSELGGFAMEAGVSIVAPGKVALDLTNAEIRSDVTAGDGVEFRGSMMLVGARIKGRLHLDGMVLTEPFGASLIKADGASIDGNVDIQRMRATGGQLKFWRCTLGGGFDATGAILENPGGATVRLHQADVRGSVRLVSGFTSTGCVLLNRSVIDGRLDLAGGNFTATGPGYLNSRGAAIQSVSATVRGGMDLGWNSITPAVDFTGTTTTALQDDPSTWPELIYIAGFSYDRFATPRSGGPVAAATIWDWRRRYAWLRRQAEYDAGPFEQAARVFRQHGYTYGAEQLLIAQRTHARHAEGARRSWPRNMLDAIYGLTVGYGYRPNRVLWLLALLLVLVTASLALPAVQNTLRATDEGQVFTTTGMLSGDTVVAAPHDPCGNGRVRCFNPVLYAVDTVVPLIALDQRMTWYPDHFEPWGWVVEWWLNLAAVVGWLLSSIFLLSFARLARSS